MDTQNHRRNIALGPFSRDRPRISCGGYCVAALPGEKPYPDRPGTVTNVEQPTDENGGHIRMNEQLPGNCMREASDEGISGSLTVRPEPVLAEVSLDNRNGMPVYTILFVDENEEILIQGKKFLEMSGNFVVETAQSGTRAMEKIWSKAYDGILSEYFLGATNGIDLLCYTRAKSGNIPFILFTSNVTDELFEKASECGADNCVTKDGDPKSQFLLLEEMFRTLIELSMIADKLKDHQDQVTRFRELSGTSGDAPLLLMNMPGGCLGRTLNGGSCFYFKKCGFSRGKWKTLTSSLSSSPVYCPPPPAGSHPPQTEQPRLYPSWHRQ